MEEQKPFRLLSHDEFDRLTTRERVEYLRDAIAALDELRSQFRSQIFMDVSARRDTKQ